MDVLVARDGPVATLTVNRPKALNAINGAVIDALREAVGQCRRDGVRAIIVTGSGDKAFVAGADIAEMAGLDATQAEAFSRRGQAAFAALQDFPGPVVAAVNGYALGGGLELALACDLIVASTSAKLGLPESTLAVVPGFGGSQRLARRVGPARAKALMMSGSAVAADEALRVGLVDHVAAPEALMAVARQAVDPMLRNGPLALAAIKRLVHEGQALPLHDAMVLESREFGRLFSTADQKEGMKAFLEKRKPAYAGR